MKLKHIINKIRFGINNLYGTIIKPHIIIGGENIYIGIGTVVAEGAILTSISQRRGQKFNSQITIGKNCLIGEYAHITSCKSVTLGDNVLTGRYVYISDNSHGDTSKEMLKIPPIERPIVVKGPVVIERNVWIGERVCILSGVTIGEGAVIAANSVVTHDVPPYSVAAGVPARVIKQYENNE